mmetsp:Transcript_18257/g.61572  ORF Transcript_18257/g.61572 Transcript_18257/m.61572 type:complete len:157 (+) Transcript_18257:120-590(+)
MRVLPLYVASAVRCVSAIGARRPAPWGTRSSLRRRLTLASVTGPVYEDAGAPTVAMYTKADCTLCDVAKGVLAACRAGAPHTLELVDITDESNSAWFEKYKYDIPVLHIDGEYWTKHRLTAADALAAITEARERKLRGGAFEKRRGEPDASKFTVF